MTASPPKPDLDALLCALTPEELVSLLTGADFWRTQAIPRLGIPSVKVTDGPNGARGGTFKNGPATACFPAGIAVASTWDPELVQAMGEALAVETRTKGASVILAPTVNLQRTVYNGRNFECHSEDPWLASEMAVAFVRGVQSRGAAATIKHFVGNESEYQRMTMSSEISERALRELYLLPFERAVKEAGVMCVMTGYNRVGGTYMADHGYLVREVLRGQWGFDGLVMTDWMAHHDTVQSVLAGCDLEMPGPGHARGARLVAAMEHGRLPRAAVEACARRVLELAQRLGRFDDPSLPPERADDLPEHRSLIRRLGAEGSVLLKNDGGLLPLAPQRGQRIALIGRAAVEPQIMGGGSATVNAHYRLAPAQALGEACPGVEFVHRPGADLHRFTPVLQQAMEVEFFDSGDLSGPVIATQTLPGTEAIWVDNVPAGVKRAKFSARTTLKYVADADGEHVFSLISAGVSRARLNGEPVLDAWTRWTRGQTYFTWGCDEVIHRRAMKAGDEAEFVIEYSTELPDSDDCSFSALRFGAARALGDADLDAAVEAAASADLAIVFAGLNAEWDNEGLDRPGIDLPHRQNELIARVAAANPRTVVVLQSGSPLLLPWLDQVPALLQAWYPGQECGHSIADVLLGQAEPGGRLPQTWPRRLEDGVAFGDPAQYPGVDGKVHYREELLIGYRHHEARALAPLFEFGHGLSYTRFEMTDLRIANPAFGPGDTLRVALTLRNAGTRAGSEVVQLYVKDPQSTLERPATELKAFAKVRLAAGESRDLTLTLGMRAFAAFDVQRRAWWAEAGEFEILVGRSSQDIALRATVRLGADWLEPLAA